MRCRCVRSQGQIFLIPTLPLENPLQDSPIFLPSTHSHWWKSTAVDHWMCLLWMVAVGVINSEWSEWRWSAASWLCSVCRQSPDGASRTVLDGQGNSLGYYFSTLLVHDVFVTTNRRTIVMKFICLSGTVVHCDHTVHFSADLSLQLNIPMFWTPWH